MLTMRKTLKHFNHLGSAGLLGAALLLAIVVVLPSLGWTVDWKPKTTPYRLATHPFIGWSLLVFLGAGLVLIRMGPALLQCVSALVFVGAVFGVAGVSALFWDAWLSPMLVFAALPVQLHAAQTLVSLVRDGAVHAPAQVQTGR